MQIGAMIKSFVVSMFAIALIASVGALVLWPLWNEGPHTMGAPVLGYLPIAATLAGGQVLFYVIYLAQAIVRAMVRDLVDSM